MSSVRSSPTPAHFEQAVSVLHKDDVLRAFPSARIRNGTPTRSAQYVEAGYDEIYVTQIGPDQDEFLRFYEREVLPFFAATALQ